MLSKVRFFFFFKAEKKDGILDHASTCNFAFLRDDAKLPALNSHNSAEKEIDKWENNARIVQESISSAEDLHPVELQETSSMGISVIPGKIFILYFFLG